jgi:hypothetical protein
MVAEIRQLISPGKKIARPSLPNQLAFVALANSASGLLWWAVSGRAWVAALTVSAQAGGPALVALLGYLFGRQSWTAPDLQFNPRRVAVWAYFTGALVTLFAMVLSQTW